MGSPLQEKSKAFALQIIKVCNEVKREKRESVLTNQLVRSGTSVGANIREAFYAHGRADFIAKLQIALKECSESEPYEFEGLKITASTGHVYKYMWSRGIGSIASFAYLNFKESYKDDYNVDVWQEDRDRP